MIKIKSYKLLLLIPFYVLLLGCEQRSVVQRIQEKGELLVAVLASPTSYYQGPDGPMGFEYDLARRFAQSLGVKARFLEFKTEDALILAMTQGEAHLAAANLAITPSSEKVLRFSKPYQSVKTHVVYRRGSRKPREVGDLSEGKMVIAANNSHRDRLAILKTTDPRINWSELSNSSTDNALGLLNDAEFDFTLANNNQLLLSQRYNHHLNIAFTLPGESKLAWAFAKSLDDSLLRSADVFISVLTKYDFIAELTEKYYGHTDTLNFVDKRLFFRHIEKRLPQYKEYFLAAELETDIDWRLLAAIGYQESHWDPTATSSTGVRGIMMLTRATAKDLGIKNRIDPEKSIMGGAQYLRILEQKIAENIANPDRIWLALAGYNLGFRHLARVRDQVQKSGGNPDSWHHVKQQLPKASSKNKKNFSYSRGVQARSYVDHIRYYYDLLNWKLEN